MNDVEWNGKHTHPLLAPWYATDAVKVAQDMPARGDSSMPWRVMEVPWQAQSSVYLDSGLVLRASGIRLPVAWGTSCDGQRGGVLI